MTKNGDGTGIGGRSEMKGESVWSVRSYGEGDHVNEELEADQVMLAVTGQY